MVLGQGNTFGNGLAGRDQKQGALVSLIKPLSSNYEGSTLMVSFHLT